MTVRRGSDTIGNGGAGANRPPIARETLIATRPILIYGARLLRQRAEPVSGDLAALRPLVDDMFETMYAEPGIGLAAPQIGVSKRLVVIDAVPEEDGAEALAPKLVLVNPEIMWFSPDRVPYEEGCLSVPDILESVERPRAIRFRYTDLDGRSLERDTAGLLARVVQHEVDHLNGILFIDRVSLVKKQFLRKKLRQLADTSRA